MKKFKTLQDGEWRSVGRSSYHLLGCCDCKLTHLLEFELRGQRIWFRGWRLTRTTAKRRRGKRQAILKATR